MAVLLNNSYYYFNYRMVGNIIGLAQKLRKLGYPQEKIFTASNQASFNYPANFPPNSQRLIDDEPTKNILDKDYSQNRIYEDTSLQMHLNSFSGRHDENDPLNKRIDYDDVDNLFIFLTGHGGDYYMKVLYQDILFAQHFADYFEELFIRKKVKQALVLSDTCSAGTLFFKTNGENVKAILLGSSEYDDFALSSGWDHYIGQPLKDKFSYALMQKLEDLSKKKKNLSFQEFIDLFPEKKILSKIFFFNWMKKKRKDIKIDEFLYYQKPKIITENFDDNFEEINNFFNNQLCKINMI